MKRFLVSIFYLDEIICPSLSIRNRELIFLGRGRTNTFEDNTCAQLATAICSKFLSSESPVFSTNVYLVLMANFNPYQFANSHYSPDYSQYGDGLFSPFSSQMFSQDSQPSTIKVLYIEQIKQRLKKCC